MKNIKIANYSVYSDGVYTEDEMNFIKLYKGVRVNVCFDGDDPKYMHFSIRTNKVKNTIWKRDYEKMNYLLFDDRDFSITCDFEKEPTNKSKKILEFDENVYKELKKNIPEFMLDCGCRFDKIYSSEFQMELIF